MQRFLSAIVAVVLVGSTLLNATEQALAAEPDDLSVTVPFELIDNRNFIDVMLNGHGPFKIILDTGGGDGITITPEVAKELGLVPQGHYEISGAGPGSETIARTEIADVQLGKIHLRKLKTACRSGSQIPEKYARNLHTIEHPIQVDGSNSKHPANGVALDSGVVLAELLVE